MAIMLAGVEYPIIDTTVKVPEKLETTPIDGYVIKVPIIPGTVIDNGVPGSPKIPGSYIDSTIKIPNPDLDSKTADDHFISGLATGKIDTKISIPNPELEEKPENFSLLGEMKKYLPELKTFTVNSLVDSFVPVLSEDYLKTLSKFRLDVGYKDPNEDHNNLLGKFENRFNKAIYSITKKAGALNREMTLDVETGNHYLYGEIPQGWVNTLSHGKVRWEKIDWAINSPDQNSDAGPVRVYQGYDQYLASQGIIKLADRVMRPDLNLETSNAKDIVDIGDAKNSDNAQKYYDKHFSDNYKDNPVFKNRSMYYLMSSGSDFINNMFDVAIVFQGLDENDPNFKSFSTVLQNSVTDGISINQLTNGSNETVLMVRTSSIEIPQIENETFPIKYLGYSINKVRSKIKYDRKSSLKMLIDEPLYVRLLFNLLSGTSKAADFRKKSSNKEIEVKRRGDYDHRPKRFYPGHLTSNLKIQILVKHEALLNYPYLIEMKNNWRKMGFNTGNDNMVGFAENTPAEYPVWWFQDVRFLGEADDLTFDRDNTTFTELTYPFVFSRCIKMDRSVKIVDENIFEKVYGNGDTTDKLLDFTGYQSNQEWMKSTEFWKSSSV
jgi:hypothetical protein